MNQPVESDPDNIQNTAAAPGGIRPYDFKQPKLVSKEIIRSMRNIHELFVRHAKRIFTSVLNHPIEVSLLDVEQVIFSHYLNNIDPPSSIFMFNVEELGEWAILQMQPGFCIYCVERQSGGFTNKPGSKRPLTRIEEKIMGRIVDRVFRELSHAWSPYLSFTINHYVYENKPENIRTISAHAPGIVLNFVIRFEEHEIPFSICYPYALIKDNLLGSNINLDEKQSSYELSTAEKKSFQRDMKQVNIDFRVVLGNASVSLKKLVSLQEGDVILLDQQIEEALKIKVNDRVKMKGYPGAMNGKKAVKIFDINKTDPNQLDI